MKRIIKNKMTVVEALRDEASKNKAFHDICEMFVNRQRTRFTITLNNLMVRMEEAGYKNARKDYADVLEFLASLGVGQLVRTTTGNVAALDGISLRLQSIGAVALHKSDVLQKQTPVRKFENLTAPIDAEVLHNTRFIELDKPIAKAQDGGNRTKVRESAYPAFLTLLIDGKIVNFPGPTELKAENLGDFLVKFKRLAKEIEM